MKRIPKKQSEPKEVLDAEYLEVKDNVPPLPAKRREPEQPAGTVTVTINGDSLDAVGIFDGDGLVCRTRFEDFELTNGRLVVAQLPCLGLVVKFYHKYKNTIILRSANPRYNDLIYPAELVEVKAIVIQSIKNWE